jgi:hypothetical protein
MLTFSGKGSAQVQDWPDVFDPTVVYHLNIQTVESDCFTPDPTTWPLVQQDTTFLYEVPALFWEDGETPICVSLRRKSADALGDPGDPKIAMKLDMNEIVPGTRWHGLRKVSLENGDDVDPAVEGIAWQMEKLARDAAGAPADYTPGLASWVTVAVNGTEYGIYINVEQRDKSFLQNRGIWDNLHTWLYKSGEMFEAVQSPGAGDSPAKTALCYSPFSIPATCTATPDDATLEAWANALVDMDVMLTQGAVEAFIVAPDQLFSKSKNYYMTDWDAPVAPNPLTLKRRYLPWDLDTVFQGVDQSIYCNDPVGPTCNQSPMQETLLEHPTFRPQFERIMCELLAGPFQASTLTSLVTSVETTISAALKADPNNNIGDAAAVDDRFDWIRQYVTDRTASTGFAST